MSNAEPITVARGMEYADEAGPGRGLQKPGEGLGQPRWSTQGWGVLGAERCEEAHEGMSEEKKKVAWQTKKKNAASCHSRA